MYTFLPVLHVLLKHGIPVYLGTPRRQFTGAASADACIIDETIVMVFLRRKREKRRELAAK